MEMLGAGVIRVLALFKRSVAGGRLWAMIKRRLPPVAVSRSNSLKFYWSEFDSRCRLSRAGAQSARDLQPLAAISERSGQMDHYPAH